MTPSLEQIEAAAKAILVARAFRIGLGLELSSLPLEAFNRLMKEAKEEAAAALSAVELGPRKRELTFGEGGCLAEALGVSDECMGVIDELVNRRIEERASFHSVLLELHAMNLSDAEWTAAIYGLGIFHGRIGRF